jgi:DNA-binding NtrC family response regulator
MESSEAIWIVEDEPSAAELAADLCKAAGAEATVFRSPVPFLRAFREARAPMAIVLDWRLEQELSAALFLATRHRFPDLPVIFWTGSEPSALPTVIHEDPHTTVIDKAAGSAAFEKALAWARRHAQSEEAGADRPAPEQKGQQA